MELIENLIDDLLAKSVRVQLTPEGQLNISAPDGTLTPALVQRLRDNKVALIDYLGKANAAAESSSIAKAPEMANYPLSSSQFRMWILSKGAEASQAYHMPLLIDLPGNVNAAALEKAVTALVARHEILRTIFVHDAELEAVRQQVLSVEEAAVKPSFTTLSADERDEFVQQEIYRAFDLENGPLIRISVVKTSEETSSLLMVIHHIISDGWSMQVLNKELLAFYQLYASEQEVQLPAPSVQYKDFAFHQQEQLQSGALEASKEYWLNKLGGEIPVLDLPTHSARPAVKTFNGETIDFALDVGTSESLKKLANNAGGTLFMALLAGVKGLLSRYSTQQDILVGSPVAGRDSAELADQIGFYVQTVALRTSIESADDFQTLLKKIVATTTEAYQHQNYPFDNLVEDLQLQYDPSRSPLFDVMVAMQNIGDSQPKQQNAAPSNEAAMQVKDTAYTVAKFDMTFSFAEAGESVQGRLEYNTDVYDTAFVSEMVSDLVRLFDELVKAPHTPLLQLNYLSSEISQKVLGSFVTETSTSATAQTFLQAFQANVAENGEQIAVQLGESSFTYNALDKWTNNMAAVLQNKHQLASGQIAIVEMSKSPLYVAMVLAIMKTGAAFLPVDPSYPADRKSYLKTDSEAVLYCDEAFVTAAEKEFSSYSNFNAVAVQKSNPAYVIYTSGSTGKPKGVLLSHAALTNLCSWHQRYYNATSASVATVYASIAFDASIWEIFPTLFTGGTLKIVPEALRLNLPALVDFMQAERITQTFLPTPVFNELIAQNLTEGLQEIKVLVGGDELTTLPDASLELYNNYGPTENAVVATATAVDQYNKQAKPSLGRPIDNVEIYILNNALVAEAIGVVGELCIGGESLADGYLNRPALTAEKFVNHPFKAGKKLYKTGDLGYWLPDGQIAFVGREDGQLKIRGHRIELGEIERVLQEQPELETAVVVPVGTGSSKQLLAWLVFNQEFDLSALKQRLAARLPAYMIPTQFARIEALPLTVNGKVDRKALPNPTDETLLRLTDFVAARDEVEQQLVDLWEDLLAKDQIGIHDNFFELGGNSLKGVTLLNSIHKTFNVTVDIQEIFNHPTIAFLAEEIKNKQWINHSQLDEEIESEEFVI